MRNTQRILLAGLLAMSAMATAVSQQGQQETAPQTIDLVATATKTEGFKTFVGLVEKAGLTQTLKEPGPYTVLVPTDEAFEKVPKELLDKVSADPELLKKVLTYHVVKGTVASTDLKDGTETETLEGEKLKVEVKDEIDPATNVATKTFTFNEKKAKMVKADIKASNGVIHSIDAVLLPPSLEKGDSN